MPQPAQNEPNKMRPMVQVIAQLIKENPDLLNNFDYLWTQALLAIPDLKLDGAHCNFCGSSIMKHKHTLSPGMVNAFMKFAAYIRDFATDNTAHPQKDVKLTYNEYANFQKLRYFNLAHFDKKRPGNWLITKNGGFFLRGQRPRPFAVVTYHNRIVERSTKMVWIKDYWLKKHPGENYEYWQRNFSFQEGEGDYDSEFDDEQ